MPIFLFKVILLLCFYKYLCQNYLIYLKINVLYIIQLKKILKGVIMFIMNNCAVRRLFKIKKGEIAMVKKHSAMKKRIVSWLLAAGMMLSPAGVGIGAVPVIAEETTTVSESMTSDESAVSEESEPSETTAPSEEATPEETTVPSEETEPSETTVPSEETGSDETTAPSEETDPDETTVPSEETESEETSASDEETTEETSETEDDEEEEDEEEGEYGIPQNYEVSLPYGDAIPSFVVSFEISEEEAAMLEAETADAVPYIAASNIYSDTRSYNALTSTQKSIYNKLYAEASRIDNTSGVSYTKTGSLSYEGGKTVTTYLFETINLGSCSTSDAYDAFDALGHDHPELFWLGHALYIGSSGGSVYGWLCTEYSSCSTGAGIQSRKTKIFNVVNDVLSEASKYGNDYSKEYYITTYLVDKNTYDLDGAYAHDISGILLDGRAVCESYAKCFSLFMNALGIPNNFVVGLGNGGGHAWNQVQLDGDWYNYDATWLDQGSYYWWKWFNATDTPDFRTMHEPGVYWWHHGVYPCTATKYSYSNHAENFSILEGYIVSNGSEAWGYDTLNEAIDQINTLNKASASYSIEYVSEEVLEEGTVLTVEEQVELVAKQVTFAIDDIKINFSKGINTEAGIIFDGCSAIINDTAIVGNLTLTNAEIELNANIYMANLKTTGDSLFILGANGEIPYVLNISGTVTASPAVKVILSGVTAANGMVIANVTNAKVTADKFSCAADEYALIRSGNEIRFASASIQVTDKTNDEVIGTYMYWDDVLAAINANGTASTEWEINLLEDTAVEKLTFPAASKAKSITFTGGVFDIGNTALTIPYSVTFANKAVFFTAVDTKGAAAAAVKVSANAVLNFAQTTYNSEEWTPVRVKSITGTNTSSLILNQFTSLMAADVKTFGTVNANGSLNIEKTMSAISNFSGILYLHNASAVITINNISGDSKIGSNIASSKADKITVNAIDPTATLTMVVNGGEALPGGTTILYAPKDITENITITNVTEDGKKLDPFYYKKTKEIKAEYAGAITVDNGTEEKNFPNIDLALEWVTDSSKDYTITFNEENVTIDNLVLPKTAKSCTIKGDNITLGNKTLNIPVYTTIIADLNAENTNIKVAANTMLDLFGLEIYEWDYRTNNVKSITGTKTSVLSVTGLTIGDIKTFELVGLKCRVTGNMSGISCMTGDIEIQNNTGKNKIVIEKVTGDTTFKYLTGYDSTGAKNLAMPNVTVNAVEDGSTITIGEYELNYDTDVKTVIPGTVFLYSKADISGSVQFAGKTSSGKDVYAHYTLKTKAISAENATAVTLYADGEKVKDYISVEAALADVKNVSVAYSVQLNEDLEVANLVLPKTAKGIEFIGEVLTLGNKTLAVPVDAAFGNRAVEFTQVDRNNESAASITVAAGKKFTIATERDIEVKSITGTKTSGLSVVSSGLKAADIKTFAEITTADECWITVSKSVSAVANLSGNLSISDGKNVTVTIDNIAGNSEFLFRTIYVMPKITVNAIDSAATLTLNTPDDDIPLAGGKLILYSKNPAIVDNIVFTNKSSDGKEIAAVYNTGKKAVYTAVKGGIVVNDTEKFNTLDDAFAYINENGASDATAEYTIDFVSDTVLEAFAIPKTIKNPLVLTGGTVYLNKISSLNFAVPVTFEDFEIDSVDGKAYNINAANDVTIDGFAAWNAKSMRGNSKKTLTLADIMTVDDALVTLGMDITAFGTVNVTGEVIVNGALSCTTLTGNGTLVVDTDAVVKVKDINSDEKLTISYCINAAPVAASGKVTAPSILLTAYEGKLADGQLVMTGKNVDISLFAIDEASCPDEREYVLSKTANNIYVRAVALEVTDGTDNLKFATWADFTAYVNANKNADAEYVITLTGDYNAGGPLTMPKAGYYKSIKLKGGYMLTFTGNLTLTGDLSINGVNISAVNRNGDTTLYSINAGKYDLIVADSNTYTVSNLSAAAGSTIKLSNTGIGGNVNADTLIIEGSWIKGNVKVTKVLDFAAGGVILYGKTVNAYSITNSAYAVGVNANILMLDGCKLTIGKGGVKMGTYTITYQKPDFSGYVTYADGTVLGTITGTIDSDATISVNDGESVLKAEKGKLVVRAK